MQLQETRNVQVVKNRFNYWTPLISFVVLSLYCLPVEAAVYNLRLTTDNVADYTDIESLTHSVTDKWQTPQEKCIAIWSLGRQSRHQTSCATEGGHFMLDPIHHYNSYGSLNCGVISSLNISCWHQLGYETRYVQLGDHTVSEVSWDGGEKWHMFDSSMSFFCYNHDGEVASCEEIKESHACELSGGVSEPGHYYLYHGAPQCVTHLGPDAWRKASDSPVQFDRTLKNGADSFTDGYSPGSKYIDYAHYGLKYSLNLLPHQTYTRYWQPLETVPGFEERFTAAQSHRPVGSRAVDPKTNNLRGNGLWVFEPKLDDPDCLELLYDDFGIELRGTSESGAAIHPSQAGKVSSVTFRVSSANAITSLRVKARVTRKTESDRVRLLLSRDAGMSWSELWKDEKTGDQDIQLNLLDEVAGAFECLFKVEMQASENKEDVGLDAIKITTVTQLNRLNQPKLTLGSNQISLSADEQAETVNLWPVLANGKDQDSLFECVNTHFMDERFYPYKAIMGPAKDGEKGYVTWRFQLPTEVTGVEIGTIAINKSKSSYVTLGSSFDGNDYKELLAKTEAEEAPLDKQYIFELPQSEIPAGAKEFYLKTEFETKNGAATYTMPGIQDLWIRVFHKPRNEAFQPIEVTYRWIEHRESEDVERSHTEVVNSLPHNYQINTAGFRDPTMLSVRTRLADESQTIKLGYSDGEDVGDAYEKPKVTYVWGKNLAYQKPYTTSRPASDESRNPDTDGAELTNSKIIAATPDVYREAIQAATAFWSSSDPVTFVIDLGETKDFSAVRVSTQQPDERFCHPAEVRVSTSSDGKTWNEVGVIEHSDLWNTPADYEAWEHDEDPKYASLPAGGRLAYSFPLLFDQPQSGRFVRFSCQPLEGHGLGMSELQVFDTVEVIPEE